ncbi:TonB-dependent receptor [Helicobacter sp. 23-1048]
MVTARGGGVVNILTQKRYETPYFSAGLSYSNTIASVGNNYNADVRVGGKIGDGTYITTSAAYIDRGGPRLGDRTNGAQGSFSLTKDFGPDSSVSFDIDYFAGIIRTTPNNSFNDIANPSKSDRGTAGTGSMRNSQRRLDVSLAWNMALSENSKFDVRAFYHLNKIKYEDSITNLTNYRYGTFAFATTSADQSGSLFDDQKAGVNAKYDLNHTNGRFMLGLESVYQISNRTMEQLINASGGTGAVTAYNHPMHIAFNGNKWNTALFALEKYDFGKRFSLTGGARYEYAYYDIDVLNQQTITMTGGAPVPIRINANGYLKDSLHNYALELTPNIRYSDNGNIFVKYEKGFFSPSPNSMLTRSGSNYITTNLKQEDYHTFELGLKDFWGSSVAFSASVFYTLTQNEFYTIGNAHSASGVVYGNYDRTSRAGVELFSEQYLLGGDLSISESVTYIDARILRNNGASVKNLLIPYVSNYKATIGLNYNVSRNFGIWIQNSFYGQSKDIETFTTTGQGQAQTRTSNGQKTIPAYSLTDIGLNVKLGDFSLSAGVRNVFDTFYYSYYNGDASDSVAGYGFLIGAGRSAFLEGRLSF